jgi:hypothetical protein
VNLSTLLFRTAALGLAVSLVLALFGELRAGPAAALLLCVAGACAARDMRAWRRGAPHR